jgi:hypothetical protein
MNDAPAALQHLQWLRRESVRAERIKTGIDAELLRSLTLATLLRDAALGRTSPVELQSIIDLRSQFRLSSAASVQRPELAEIRGALALLPADTVLLAYAPLPTEDGFMVWRVESATSPAQAAGPDITFRVVRCPLYQFERSAKALQSLVVNGEPGAAQLSDELYKVLFGNTAPIPRGKTLAVWFVGSVQPPFELLGPDAEHMFLGANPVVYLADLIGPPDNPAPDRRKAVIIGHPGTALAGVARETAEIARILKLPDGVADPPAADAARLLAGSRIIHVAAHSVIDHRNPLRSLIELKDGSLEAWQMADSTRGTDLIVLSACDTRRGPDWGGTTSLSAAEAPSLSSAVSLGGARTVLSSSSPVDDSVSADLIIDFYTLLDGTPTQALFRARQRALARDIAPVRIANFVLSARDLESLSVSFATPRR